MIRNRVKTWLNLLGRALTPLSFIWFAYPATGLLILWQAAAFLGVIDSVNYGGFCAFLIFCYFLSIVMDIKSLAKVTSE